MGGEEYKGIKFTCKISGKISAPDSIIKEYLQIDSSLKEFLSPNKNEGNMSMRIKQGFIIKGAGEKMTELNERSLSHIIKVDESSFTLTAEGKTPSSESFLHHLIYKSQPKINLILHFHDDSLLEALKEREFCRISPLPYGSIELARAASKPKEDIILLKNHGFILKAKSAEELLKMVGHLYSLR
jgi:ribulose-5-phosphate 4-epimerase/fuculose-1-phosphate aldolase